MRNIKIIIAGGRDLEDRKFLYERVDEIINIATDYRGGSADIEIVSGKARGADRLGEEYGHEHDYRVAEFPADWEKLGKKAGYIRNEQMAEYADILIAFWDGKSKGTKHMIDLALKHGLETHVFKY